MSIMVWVWLAAIVLFGIVEAVTAGLVSIWFVAGSAAALVAAALGATVLIQVLLFAVVSAIALALTRPVVRKLTKQNKIPTNADRVLDEEAKVTERISNVDSTGSVYVDGKTWSARAVGEAVIPEGSIVRIRRMEGVKLYVEPIKETEEVK